MSDTAFDVGEEDAPIIPGRAREWGEGFFAKLFRRVNAAPHPLTPDQLDQRIEQIEQQDKEERTQINREWAL